MKFVCGEAEEKILAPGRYWTAINVLNPNDVVVFNKRISVAMPGEEAGKVFPPLNEDPISVRLDTYLALEIDTDDIYEHLEKYNFIKRYEFVKGFVIIESPIELDVVAVYTAIGKEDSTTMHMERVFPRSLARSRSLRIDVTFEGEESKLETALVGLGRTRTSGVMIGTLPTPEMPKSDPGRDVFFKMTFTGERSRLEGALLDLGRLKSAGRCNIETIPVPE